MYINIKTVKNFSQINYQNFTKPVLITDGCKDMKAINKWNTKYLISKFKDKIIDVEVYPNKNSMALTNNFELKKKNLIIY